MSETALPTIDQLNRVNKAFSRQSAGFDSEERINPVHQWMRARVRNHVSAMLKPGSRILELNAGTGLDAAYFAGQGHFVHATDISDGMIAQLNQKIAGGVKNILAEKKSYADLSGLPEYSFDCIFSNFGGLNCTPHIDAVISQFERLLKPGGVAILVVMPRISPWEILSVLKGNFRQAARRFRKNGTPAQIEGQSFTTWYYSPSRLISYFGDRFMLSGLHGLGSFVPPPSKAAFPGRYPRLFSLLCKIEERTAHRRPFNRMADHYILTMKRKT